MFAHTQTFTQTYGNGQMLSAPTEQTPKYPVGADIIRPKNGEANS